MHASISTFHEFGRGFSSCFQPIIDKSNFQKAIKGQNGLLAEVQSMKFVINSILYMSFAVGKTANSKCLASKFADSKYLDSKKQMKITNFFAKMGDFQEYLSSACQLLE